MNEPKINKKLNNKHNKSMEQPKKEQPKTPPSAEAMEGKRKLPYEIELEQRPMPQKGEAHPDWLKRIGGPNVRVEKIGRCEKCGDHTRIEGEVHLCEASIEQKKSLPAMITEKGDFFLNSENIGTYIDKEKIDKKLGEKDPNIIFLANTRAYLVRKELFQTPDIYFRIIAEELKNKRKIVADKGFGESIEKWGKELKGEKVEEKPEEKKVEKKKKNPKKEVKEEPKEEPKKQKTITELEEEMEGLQTAYAPLGWFRKKPVIQDLGYYINQNRIKEIKAEIEKLKAGKPAPAEGKEEKKPAASQGEQAGPPKSKGFGGEKAKQKSVKEEYKKDGWVYKFGKKIREQKPKEIIKKVIDKTKKGIEAADKLGKRKKQKEIGLPEEVEENIEIINKRLKKLHSEIRTSSVLKRSALEKEQRRLEKRLKKLKKK